MSNVVVTGGAGYIGTHVICALAAVGRRCISIDNYSNSSPLSIERVLRIAPGSVEAFEADIRDVDALRWILGNRDVDSLIHLAALKGVGESVEQPERYYNNNVIGTQSLLAALAYSRLRKVVFSSSATVYGALANVPIRETATTSPSSPYGQNKLAIEAMLAELADRDASWRVTNLRYFNPVGAHESGLIGEDPKGIPNNLMPFICQVAAGKRQMLNIFGADYPTLDGTGVRDYIHVLDLAEGHIAALRALEHTAPGTVLTLNLGTGRGYSVLELIETFERVNAVRIPRQFVARRGGDIPICYADPELANKVIGWRAKRGIEEMCRDAWRWQVMNPEGYK